MKAYIIFQSVGISSRLSVSCKKETFIPPSKRPESPYMNDTAQNSLHSIMERSVKDVSEQYENLALTRNKVSIIVYLIWTFYLFLACCCVL